jgi:pyridoxal phosphate enzyme (YggS family)
VLDTAALRARLEGVRERIANAARRGGRDPSTVRLVAVSKTFPAEYIRAAYEAGHRDFGENRVQEALDKRESLSDLDARWHLVGHLQSNKARKAAEFFHVVQSVDDEGLLRKLNQSAADAGRTVDVLIQVDFASEPTKHGARPDAVPGILKLAADCAAARVSGLMLLPPAVEDPEGARPHFSALRRLRDELVAGGAPFALPDLSMGMSHDFEVAIEEGATIVRVGTAIFGSRPQRGQTPL